MTSTFKKLNHQFEKYLKKFTTQFPFKAVVTAQSLLILAMAFAITLIYITLKETGRVFTQSSGATVELIPSQTNFLPGSPQSMDLVLNTNNKLIDGVQLSITFSGSQPTDLTVTPETISGLTLVANSLTSSNGNQVLTFAYITTNPINPYTTNSSQVKLATFSFTAPIEGEMAVTFNPTLSKILENQTSANILTPPTNGSYTFVLENNNNPPSLYFATLNPPNPQQVGSEFTVQVMANTGEYMLSAVDAIINYDENVVEILEVTQADTSPFSSYPELDTPLNESRIYISANIGTSSNPVPVQGSQVPIALIRGRTLAPTTGTELSYIFNLNDRNDSNMVLYLDETGQEPLDVLAEVQNQNLIAQTSPGQITATPTPTVPFPPTKTPVPTASATGTPTPTVTPTATPIQTNKSIQIALQGRNRSGANRTTTITVRAQQVSTGQITDLNLTTNSSGQAQFQLEAGNYVFLVSAPGYLPRKFGTGASPLVVNSGLTTLDLSQATLLGGDFNADNTVNEVDYTLFFLNALRRADNVIDLDGSGQVNHLDFAIMRSNWGRQGDTL